MNDAGDPQVSGARVVGLWLSSFGELSERPQGS